MTCDDRKRNCLKHGFIARSACLAIVTPRGRFRLCLFHFLPFFSIKQQDIAELSYYPRFIHLIKIRNHAGLGKTFLFFFVLKSLANEPLICSLLMNATEILL